MAAHARAHAQIHNTHTNAHKHTTDTTKLRHLRVPGCSALTPFQQRVDSGFLLLARLRRPRGHVAIRSGPLQITTVNEKNQNTEKEREFPNMCKGNDIINACGSQREEIRRGVKFMWVLVRVHAFVLVCGVGVRACLCVCVHVHAWTCVYAHVQIIPPICIFARAQNTHTYRRLPSEVLRFNIGALAFGLRTAIERE